MVAKSTKSSTTTGAGASACSEKRFKGVRMRSWGKWVSEIRLPNTRARLWLGSYTTAEQAARAFDVAVVCLRGRSAALNFPHSPPAYAPLGLPHLQIQELAASAAASSPSSSTISSSLAPTQFDSRASSASQVGSPTSAASDESEALSWDQCSRFSSTSAETEAATTDMMRLRCGECSSLSSTSAESDKSEAATTNEINSSSCSSSMSTAHNSGSLEDLLLLDDEQSSPLSTSPFATLQDQEQALNSMGSEWEELLWGISMSSYSPWDQHLLPFPPLPVDDDLPAIMEPCLWSL